MSDVIKKNIKELNISKKATCKKLKIKEVDVDLFFENQARVVFKDKTKVKKIYERFKKEKFIKSKISDIASEFLINKRDLENFIYKTIHAKLIKETDFSQLSKAFMEEIESKASINSDELKFIKHSTLKNSVSDAIFLMLNNGFVKNIQGVKKGVMASNAGDGTEHLFLGRAILAGFAAAITDVRSLGYDAVIDIEGKLLRVQVKGFSGNQISKKSRDRGGQGIDPKDPSNLGRSVTSDNVDIFAAVNKSSLTEACAHPPGEVIGNSLLPESSPTMDQDRDPIRSPARHPPELLCPYLNMCMPTRGWSRPGRTEGLAE